MLKMDDLDVFFEVMGVDFLLVSTITQQILIALGPNLYHGCISGVSCGRRSPAVACWASDHWVTGLNPLGGMFHH